jgi:hypothetical protein
VNAAARALLLCVLAALLATPPVAAGATRSAPLSEASALDLPAPDGPFRDTIVEGTRRLGRATGAAERLNAYPVLGGARVDITSTHYSDDAMQGVATVLGGLVHGPEMSLLSVYLASPDEIDYICGPQALACYAPGLSLMVISGESGSSYGVPRDYTIAHEYGHHIANFRNNAPWTALDTGAKRWATYERVCQGVRNGQLFPGDEDLHYWDNPGEGFAEANAHLNFPGVSVAWGYSPLLRPDAGSMARLKADIVSPWSGPVTQTWNGSWWPKRRNPAQRRFSTPLDGQVRIELIGPAGSNYDLFILGPKLPAAKQKKRHRPNSKANPRRRVIDRATSGGSNEQLEMTLCGQGEIRVEVRRRAGSGPFKVNVTRP